VSSKAKYAAATAVPVEKSEGEIKATLRRYGATAIATMESANGAQIAFELNGRRIIMRMSLPRRDEHRFTHGRVNQSRVETRRSDAAALAAWEQACRQKWRALALCIKAKLEAVEAEIETFEEAFLAHVMLPGGETFGEWAQRPENLPAALSGRPLPPLLGGPQP
jgi:hypothetical protein